MAIEDVDVTTLVARKVERTFRFDGYVPREASPYVDIYRERYWRLEDGSPVGVPVVTVTRKAWPDIADKSWTLTDGSVVTAAQVFEALAMAFDELSIPPPPTEDSLPEQPEEPTDGQTD